MEEMGRGDNEGWAHTEGGGIMEDGQGQEETAGG